MLSVTKLPLAQKLHENLQNAKFRFFLHFLQNFGKFGKKWGKIRIFCDFCRNFGIFVKNCREISAIDGFFYFFIKLLINELSKQINQ
jgi:hypothetical protein